LVAGVFARRAAVTDSRLNGSIVVMARAARPLAIVTGASSGIGYELAKCCADAGFDLVIAADEPELEEAAKVLRAMGAGVDTAQVDLATEAGVEELLAEVAGRPVDALLANAGHGLGKGFLDQDFEEVRHVIDTNITGTLRLIQKVVRGMRARQRPRPHHRLCRRFHSGQLPGGL
jgi:uncharacterized protein